MGEGRDEAMKSRHANMTAKAREILFGIPTGASGDVKLQKAQKRLGLMPKEMERAVEANNVRKEHRRYVSEDIDASKRMNKKALELLYGGKHGQSKVNRQLGITTKEYSQAERDATLRKQHRQTVMERKQSIPPRPRHRIAPKAEDVLFGGMKSRLKTDAEYFSEDENSSEGDLSDNPLSHRRKSSRTAHRQMTISPSAPAILEAPRQPHAGGRRSKVLTQLGLTAKELRRAEAEQRARRIHRKAVAAMMETDANRTELESKMKELVYGGHKRVKELKKVMEKMGLSQPELSKFKEFQKASVNEVESSESDSDEDDEAEDGMDSFRHAETVASAMPRRSVVSAQMEKYIQKLNTPPRKASATGAKLPEGLSASKKLKTRKQKLLEELGLSIREYDRYKKVQKAYRQLGIFDIAISPKSSKMRPPLAHVSDHESDQEGKAPLVEGEEEEHELTLQEVLGTAVGLEAFTAHCCREYSEENIQFYMEVESYRQQVSLGADPKPLADAIAQRYIGLQAERQVNIPATLSNATLERLRSHGATIDVFDDAQNAVKTLMKADSFSRFVRTKEYQQVKDIILHLSGHGHARG